MSYRIIIKDELYHHGIKGQRWGVRRYQNKDGTLTLAGKRHAESLRNSYNILRSDESGLTFAGKRRLRKLSSEYHKITGISLKKKYEKEEREAQKQAQKQAKKDQNKTTPSGKTHKNMTDQELKDAITRATSERDYLRLQNEIRGYEPKPKEKKKGKDIYQSFSKSFVGKSIATAGEDFLTKALKKTGNSILGIKEEKSLKDQAADLTNKKRIAEIQDWFKTREGRELAKDTKSVIKDGMDGAKKAIEKMKYKKPSIDVTERHVTAGQDIVNYYSSVGISSDSYVPYDYYTSYGR